MCSMKKNAQFNVTVVKYATLWLNRASTPAASFYPNGLSVNSGDIVMASTYPPHRQFASNPYEGK